MPIDIYVKDVSLYKNNWLIALLEHNAFSWETITMMRHKDKTQRRDLSFFFTRTDTDHYNNSLVMLQKIYRDATVAPPGKISRALTTPLNSGWCWDDIRFTIIPKETWREDNVKSEIVEPISLDKMVEILLGPMANTNLRFNGADSDLVYDYHRKGTKVIASLVY